MTTNRIDVLAVLDTFMTTVPPLEKPPVYMVAMQEARAAVAELVQEVGDLLASHPVARTYPDGPCIESEQHKLLVAALARVKGEQP